MSNQRNPYDAFGSGNPYDSFASGSGNNPYAAFASGSRNTNNSSGQNTPAPYGSSFQNRRVDYGPDFQEPPPSYSSRSINPPASYGPSSGFTIPPPAYGSGSYDPPDHYGRGSQNPTGGTSARRPESQGYLERFRSKYGLQLPSKYKPQPSPASMRTSHGGRVHPKLLEDALSEVGRDGIRKTAYRVPDICLSLIHHCRTGIFDRLLPHQQRMILSPTRRTNSISQMRMLLDEWFTLFDRVFFFNTLRYFCKPTIYHGTEHPEFDAEFTEYGRTIKADNHIEIFLGKPPPGPYEGNSEQWYICCLLHEMTHAFFDVMGCDCSRCVATDINAHRGTGITGHATAWADAITAIERSLQLAVEWQWPVSCNLNGMGILLEKDRRTDWEPRPDQLTKWGVLGHETRNRGSHAFDVEPDFSDGGYD